MGARCRPAVDGGRLGFCYRFRAGRGPGRQVSERKAIGRIDVATAERVPVDAGQDFSAGEALVQPSLNRITVHGRVAQVEPKVMQVLLMMAARPGRVVGRETFLDTVWAGTTGDDYLLNRAVSELRRIFGDDPQRPRYIETIRKGGYRLVAPIAPAAVALALPDAAGGPSGARAPEGPVAAAGASPRTAPAVPAPAWPAGRGVLALAMASLAIAMAAAAWWPRTTPPAPPLGWDIHPLTSLVGRELAPALSPDGSRVAFVWDGGGDGFDVYLKTVGSEDLVNLSRSEADEHHPVWMPDGRSLLFARIDGHGLTILRTSALGGAVTRVITDPTASAVRGMTVSPDGTRLAYAARRRVDTPYRLVVATLDGRERRVLSRPDPRSLGDVDPRFAPDGRSIVFVRATNETTRDVYRVASDGGTPERLTFDNRKINGLAWSRDGERLLFTSTRSGMYGLWSLDPGGGGLRQLALGNEAVQQPATAPGIDAIAFEHWIHRSRLRLIDLASGTDEDAGRRLGSTRWDSSPAWSPDGTRIAFGSNRSGPHAIWVSRADGSDAAAIADFAGAFIDNPAWSPDGRSIAFDGSPDGTSAVFVVPADGGTPRRVTRGRHDSRRPSWSRDGAWLYYESHRGGAWRLYAQPAAGGEAVEVVSGPAIHARESVDGRWLLHARPDALGLWRVPRRDWAANRPAAAPELLTGDLQRDDARRWVPGRAGVYFVQRGSARGAGLALLEPESGRTAVAAALPSTFAGDGLDLAPDQSRLVYSEVLTQESDLRLAVARR